MTIKNLRKEHILLFSLLIFFLIGLDNSLKIIFVSQILLFFLFIEFKLNKRKLIITGIFSILLLYFSKDLTNIKIYLIFITFLLSLEYQVLNQNKKINILFLILFSLLLLFKISPHTNRYVLNYYSIDKINEFSKEQNLVDDYYTSIEKKDIRIVRTNTIYPHECSWGGRDLSHDYGSNYYNEKKCFSIVSFLHNRFTINSVDVNFLSLILLTIIILSLLNTKKNYKAFFIYLFFSFVILFLTKSRAGLLFFLISILIIYFKNVKVYQIVFVYFIIHILIIFFGFLLVNSVQDPMMMSAPSLSQDPLINFSIDSYKNYKFELLRLFSVFDPSNYIRFSSFFQVFLIYINDLKVILFPDHTSLINQINYVTNNDNLFKITSSDYDPHNFFMSLTKEVGLIYNIYFHYLVFTFLNNTKFRLYFVPLIFGSVFLGPPILFLIPSIFLFCFKRKKFKYLK